MDKSEVLGVVLVDEENVRLLDKENVVLLDKEDVVWLDRGRGEQGIRGCGGRHGHEN